MFTRIIAVFLRHLYLLRRSPHRIIGLFYWPTMELFIWGLLTIFLNSIGAAEFDFIPVLLSALIFWDFFNRAQQAISVSFLEDVWVRNLGNVFASPLRPFELLLGLVLVSIFQAFLSLFFVTILAGILWQLNIFQFGLWLIPFILNLFITGWVIGVIASAMVLRLGPSADILAWSLPVLIQPLSAVFYPVSVLPQFLQNVALILPTTYIFEGMRSIVLQGQFNGASLIGAFLLNGLYLILALLVFRVSYRAVRKRGLMQRFAQ